MREMPQWPEPGAPAPAERPPLGQIQVGSCPCCGAVAQCIATDDPDGIPGKRYRRVPRVDSERVGTLVVNEDKSLSVRYEDMARFLDGVAPGEYPLHARQPEGNR